MPLTFKSYWAMRGSGRLSLLGFAAAASLLVGQVALAAPHQRGGVAAGTPRNQAGPGTQEPQRQPLARAGGGGGEDTAGDERGAGGRERRAEPGGGQEWREGQERPFDRRGGTGSDSMRRVAGVPLNLHKLGLSDRQKQIIVELRKKDAGRAHTLRQDLREKRLEMRQLMFDPGATEAQIKNKRRELRQMQDQMEEMQIEDFLSLRSVLTPDQRKRLPEIMPSNHSRVQTQPQQSGGKRQEHVN